MNWGRFFLLSLIFVAYMQPHTAYAARKTKKNKKQIVKVEEIKEDLKPFTFSPPKKWECVDDKDALPAKVEAVYIGSGKKGFTPSINIAAEETPLSLEEYVTMAKNYHAEQPDTQCYLLGPYEMCAGASSLLQINKKTQWGEVRFLQASIIKNNRAYVLTATCLEEEYSNYYPQFLQSFQSFNLKPVD